MINFLSKNIYVSSAVKDQMIRKEKVNPKKIIQINYSYNFKLFNQFKFTEKKTIFNKKKINLITIGRLVDLKRHILIFKLMLKLNKSKKYNPFCLGTGVNQSN